MFYSFSKIPFSVIIHLFLIHILNAISSGGDKMLIALVKNDEKMKISEYSMQKSEAHLGIMHFMRMNWQCEKIDGKFEEYERTECQKYRKYLDILYEYLCREYFGIPTVKPKFVFKNKIEIEGPIIYAMNCLAKIFKFYFNDSPFYYHNLNKLFDSIDGFFQPKLLNEEKLNYGIKLDNEQKLPINEMILELAIDTANEWQKNENLDGILRENFNKKLEEMLKKVEESAKEYEEDEEYYDVDTLNKDENEFDDSLKWTDDALFSEFVKAQAVTDPQKFKHLLEGYSNFEKVDEDDLIQQCASYFCVVYFVRNNWQQCERTCNDNTNCQMYRKHLHILYEYLFRLYAQAKNPNESKQLAPVIRPIFVGASGRALSLIEVLINLNFVAKYSCKKAYDLATKSYPMELVNEVEFNYDKNIKENLNDSTDLNKSMDNYEVIRKEFEQKMEKICEGKSAQLEEPLWFTG